MNSRRQFKRRINEALGDKDLQTAMARMIGASQRWREAGSRGVDLDELRSQVRAIKERSVQHLPDFVAEFKKEAEAVGARVFLAADAEEASVYIAELAVQRGVSLAVKSKSMATEEIGLNAYLERRGIKVVETDLGEWIVQLAHERPSHILAPAVHKTREQIAKLFSEATGREVSSDPASLVAVARRELRQSFIDAGLGVSGANIAIANSGTLVIVSNEGNARLATALPPIHVAVLGVEKIVSSLADATKVLEVLPRSATGQKLSSYISFITGPSRTADIEMNLIMGAHGPKEVHIVLLDSGRYRMREEPTFREALYCIKCSSCLNVCLIFQSVGGHVYGHTYAGGIGVPLTAFLEGLDQAANMAELCLNCDACKEACPVRIDVPRLILAVRERLVGAGHLSSWERFLYERILPDGRALNRMHSIGRVAQVSLARRGLIRSIPFSKLASARSLPSLAAKPLQATIGQAAAKKSGATKTLFYAGCLIEHVYPEVGKAVARVLDKIGFAVALPEDQPCCGMPARYAGDRRSAITTARRMLEMLEKSDFEHLIVACPTCGEAFIHEYPALLTEEPAWHARALSLASKTADFTKFVVERLGEDGLESLLRWAPAGGTKTRIAYHDPCHLKRNLGITSEPRTILKSFADCEYVEMVEACCGMGGSFSAKFPEVSGHILARRLADIEAAGPGVLATACPGCLMHLRGGADKRAMPVKVRHIAEMLAERMDS